MDLKRSLGVGYTASGKEQEQMIKYINLKLASMGLPVYKKADTSELEVAEDLIESFKEKNRLFGDVLPPVDQRIQNFLDNYLGETGVTPRLPSQTFVLDRHGMAREMSLAPDAKEFVRDDVKSYRIAQGVLSNPLNDRRTTSGVFHVAEGGLPVPPDKKEVPKVAFAKLLEVALKPSESLKQLPFTSTQDDQASTFVSLMLRPLVCPEVPGVLPKKSLEVRFFAPGNLVGNLDFVESIFGNAGDPFLAAHDSALDPEHWTGHTGCVILAPQMRNVKKVDLGLPHISEATERQKREGMCWEKEDELYNEGSPFKICCRDDRGVIVTLIADNYFGYCKKEVKTQIGYSSNLFGLTEEEHAGGAMAYPSYNLGTHFIPDSNLKAKPGHTFENVVKCLGDAVEVKPEGYAIDKNYPNVIYMPETAEVSLETLLCTWTKDGKEQSLKVLPERTFVHPTGYKVRLEKHANTSNWRLIGTTAEGSLIHKPCTVSGGGKSEISKSVTDATIYGPVFCGDINADMDAVAEIAAYDFSNRFKDGKPAGYQSRGIFTADRSLGSVIKLLNPSEENTDEYNAWLESIPSRIKALVFLVKRFYKEEWGQNWREYFSVDIINGEPGHEIKFEDRNILGSYLRVGLRENGTWWTCKLRQDYMPAEKIQWEDDISASVLVPATQLDGLNPEYKNSTVKITENCEFRFFQRPDDAKVFGYDKQAEIDLSTPNTFVCNFEPMVKSEAIELVEDSVNFAKWTKPMQDLVRSVAESDEDQYFCSSAHARIVDGARTKNVRYLQTRPDVLNGEPKYIGQVGMRLYRELEADKPLYTPVNCVMPGRRNNPADYKAGIRPLAVYGPIHYQELPELFIDFVCSLTGKSPSTTGAGSEGALTKGPFNALTATADLNNALLSFILGDYNGFTTAAGYIGSKYAVEHDVSLLVPEVWSRLSEEERCPKAMIENGFLEPVEDFEFEGETILGSRLGYRITPWFVNEYLGRMFETPNVVFPIDMLRPELQSMAEFADGIKNICEASVKVGKAYLSDGSDKSAIPPLKAVLHVMATGKTEDGKELSDPEVRKLFTRDYVINSDWYKTRLVEKQNRAVAQAEKNIAYLSDFLADSKHAYDAEQLKVADKLAAAKEELAYVSSAKYLEDLVGTIGADPLFRG